MRDSELKPAICILNPDDVYNIKEMHAEDSYYCITPFEAISLQKEGVILPSDPFLQEGLVLTKVPDRAEYYYRTDETDCRVINERCLAIEAILSYLGGKEFRYSETSSFKANHKVGVDVGLEFEKSNLDANNGTNVNVEDATGSSGDKTVSAQWGGRYTHEGYLRAVELARVNGLASDPAIAALLEQRTPKHPNPISLQEYHVNVTADLDKNVRVLEDINAKLKDKISGGLKVDVRTSRKIEKASTVDFFISFGPIPVEEAQKAHDIENRVGVTSRNKWLWPIITVTFIAIVAAIIYFFM